MSATSGERDDVLGDLSFDQLMELERRAEERAAAGDGDGSGGGSDHGDDGDDEIVLPWWQHPVNIVTMIVTAAIVVGLIGWMIGDAGAEPAHNEVDTGFLQDMRFHHEQAVFMSFVFRELPDTDPELRVIAASIVRGQSLEVGRMVQLLRNFGEAEARDLETADMSWMGMIAGSELMPGMASEDELDELIASSGREADELFVELMTAHHLGGIEMAEYAAEHAANDEVRTMAAAMAGAQRDEILEMAGLIEPSN